MAVTIKSAMLLAAGLGTRMRPLTHHHPKPLLKVMGKTLLDYNLERLFEAGVEDITINVHYLPDAIIAHCADVSGARIHISDERAGLLDSGGGILKALPTLGPSPFFTLNADTIWLDGPNSNLLRMAWMFDPEVMDILLMVAPSVSTIGWGNRGDFSLDPYGRLSRPKKGEVAPFAYTGAAILKPEQFAGRPEKFSLNRLFDEAEAKGRLFGMRLDGAFMHVGMPEALQEAETALAALVR